MNKERYKNYIAISGGDMSPVTDYVLDRIPEGHSCKFIATNVHSMNPVGAENIERFMHNFNIAMSSR